MSPTPDVEQRLTAIREALDNADGWQTVPARQYIEHVTYLLALVQNIRRGTSLIIACPSGHPYNDANTYLDRFGRRKCRPCTNRHSAAAKRRRGRP